jgi:hypothetical protein
MVIAPAPQFEHVGAPCRPPIRLLVCNQAIRPADFNLRIGSPMFQTIEISKLLFVHGPISKF